MIAMSCIAITFKKLKKESQPQNWCSWCPILCRKSWICHWNLGQRNCSENSGPGIKSAIIRLKVLNVVCFINFTVVIESNILGNYYYTVAMQSNEKIYTLLPNRFVTVQFKGGKCREFEVPISRVFCLRRANENDHN